MKQFFYALKQKIQQPKIIETLHQQFFERMHNLDYLQWMQQNSGRYFAGICILVVLLSATVLWQQTPIETYKEIAYSPKMTEKTVSVIDVYDMNVDAQQEQQLKDAEQTVLPNNDNHQNKPSYFNPLHLSGYQAPTSGMLQYNYGLGYDTIYDDYRFHNEICYATGDGTVFACMSGVIVEAKMDQHWQLAVQTKQGTIWYAGLQTCTVSENDNVIAGQIIGTTDGLLYIQAEK